MTLDRRTPIEDLHLPSGIQLALHRERIWTIGLLLQALDDLPFFRGMGERGTETVRETLAEHGFL